MLLACFIAVVSVFIGALLGFSRRTSENHLGPIKTFAFAAATSVVATSFMPEAFGSLGVVAVIPFVVGFLSPRIVELGFTNVGGRERTTHMGLEIGYAGLSLHQLGDGVGMGALTGPSHAGHHHLDVFLAVGGHTVPVAAIVVLAFVRAKGRLVAAQRAVGLAVFVVLGVLVARYLGVSIASRWGGVTSAAVGGLLLHVASHDLGAALPKTTTARALDLAAAAAGVFVAVAGDREPGDDALDPAKALHALGALGLSSAPHVLAGVVVAAGSTALARRRNLDVKGLPEALVAALSGLALLDLRTASVVAVAAVSRWLLHEPRADEPACAVPGRPRAGIALAVPSWALGVVGGAIVSACMPASRGLAMDAVTVAAVVLFAFAGAPAAVVMAAALVQVGASDAAAVSGLAMGLTAASLGRERNRARLLAVLGLVGAVGASALVVWPPAATNPLAAPVGAPEAMGFLALAVVAGLGLRTIFNDGLRAVAASLISLGLPHHQHQHEHAHDHADPGENDGLESVSVPRGVAP